MNAEQIKLDVGNAKLDTYCPERLGERKEAILVIPGGGYRQLSLSIEGEPIALAYASRGFAAFVLHYSVCDALRNNTPLAEASAAMAYIRRNADKYNINPNKIYAVGFSAGGHLCATLGTMWHNNDICKMAKVESGENKPTAIVLCYPVISGVNYVHIGSFKNLLANKEPSASELEFYSAEKNVNEKSSPAFIIHTAEDESVPVQNSLIMAKAYADAGVQFELHIYPHGKHAFALGNDITDLGEHRRDEKYARWVDDSIYFFRNLK